MLSLAACGGGGGGGDSRTASSSGAAAAGPPYKAESPAKSGTAKVVPRITGTPETEARAGEIYVFEPDVVVNGNAPLVWTISNKPAWADFNPADGTLIGVPGDEDIGKTGDIFISVSNSHGSSELQPFSIDVMPFGNASVTLSWAPPTQNEDGSQLTDLSGYRIYYGMIPEELDKVVEIGNPGLSTVVIDDLIPNTYYFAATALNSSGIESDRSNLIQIDLAADEPKPLVANTAFRRAHRPGRTKSNFAWRDRS